MKENKKVNNEIKDERLYFWLVDPKKPFKKNRFELTLILGVDYRKGQKTFLCKVNKKDISGRKQFGTRVIAKNIEVLQEINIRKKETEYPLPDWIWDARKMNLVGLDLTGIEIFYSDFEIIEGRKMNLTGARLNGSSFDLSDLQEVDLSYSELESVTFKHTNLANSKFTNASAISGDFRWSNLSYADMYKLWASVAKFGNAYMFKTNLEEADLRSASFANAIMIKSNLAGAELKGADFFGANLQGAILDGADLSMANFANANLEDASLVNVKLFNTNLRGANLMGHNIEILRDKGAII